MGTTSLVLEPKRFAELLEQATVWADRFTLALIAPHSEHGAVPAWAHLLDAHAKAERILVSHYLEKVEPGRRSMPVEPASAEDCSTWRRFGGDTDRSARRR